jgi:glycosyltransferase involved in cell wall biosynthesis
MFLITALTFGGAETQTVRLAEEFKDRGWEVCIVSLIDPVAYGNRVRERGIEAHSLGMRRGIPDPAAIFRLRRLIEAFRPTVVHSHMFRANLLARIARIFCKIPKLVCTVDNLKETSARGGPTWHMQILYRATDRLADKTTIICNAAFERYKKTGAVRSDKLQLIPNGVDTEKFSTSNAQKRAARDELGLGPEFAWLAVGRMVKRKDYDSLLDALEQLGTCTFTLLIVGGGPLEAKLRARLDQSFFKDKIHFCGQHENSLPFYQAADGFVMPSELEGLSVALLEAASAGLPAVVTDVGGNSDIVIDGETGYLVPPKNPARLARAMRSLMDAPADVHRSFGEAARQHANESFRYSVIMEKWLKLYFDLPERASASEKDKSVSKPDFVMASEDRS